MRVQVKRSARCLKMPESANMNGHIRSTVTAIPVPPRNFADSENPKSDDFAGTATFFQALTKESYGMGRMGWDVWDGTGSKKGTVMTKRIKSVQ